MNIAEHDLIAQVASHCGFAEEVVIRAAVLRILETVVDSANNVREELLPELKAEFAIVCAERHPITVVRTCRNSESLQKGLERAVAARELFQRAQALAAREQEWLDRRGKSGRRERAA